jgi:hypothetical protein
MAEPARPACRQRASPATPGPTTARRCAPLRTVAMRLRRRLPPSCSPTTTRRRSGGRLAGGHQVVRQERQPPPARAGNWYVLGCVITDAALPTAEPAVRTVAGVALAASTSARRRRSSLPAWSTPTAAWPGWCNDRHVPHRVPGGAGTIYGATTARRSAPTCVTAPRRPPASTPWSPGCRWSSCSARRRGGDAPATQLVPPQPQVRWLRRNALVARQRRRQARSASSPRSSLLGRPRPMLRDMPVGRLALAVTIWSPRT